MVNSKISAKSRERLRRLSIAYSDDLRLKIVTELFLQEMSPSQFYRTFGGGSAARVNRHFKPLVKHGWLRFLREDPGDGRPGGVEHVYRAIDLPAFDEQTWSLLPYSIRAAYSWRGIKQLAERVREALIEGTLSAKPDRCLSSTSVSLDQLGWERVIAALDTLFESVLEEQVDSKLRVFRSEEKPFFATVASVGFESLLHGQGVGQRTGPSLPESADSPFPSALRLSKVLADDARLSIVAKLNQQAMSAAQFHRQMGGASIWAIRRRFKTLEEMAWLKKVDENTGGKLRGASEYLYRATAPMLLDNRLWSGLPASLSVSEEWRAFEQISERAKEAIKHGTFDARLDRHFAWCLLRLDQLGWEKVVSEISATLALIAQEQQGAGVRMAESGEAPIKMTVALAAFESPRVSIEAP